MNRRLAVVLAAAIWPLPLSAATFTSATSGPWNAGATWGTVVAPTAADDVIVQHDVSIPGAQSANSLTLNAGGFLSGGGTLTVAGLSWTSGQIGPGATTLVVTGSGTISGASDHVIANGTFNNQGTLTWTSGAGEIRFNATGLIENSGTLDIQTDSGIRNFAGAGPSMVNSGTIRKSAGTGTTIIGVQAQIPLTNSGGTFDVLSGLIQVTGAVTLNGNGGVTSGTIELANLNNVISNGATYSGAGYIRLPANASLPLPAGTFSISNLELSGGVLTGSGDLTITSNFRWNDGRLGSGTGSVTIAPGATMEILTASNLHWANTFIINNQGTINWPNGAGELRLDGSTTLNNSGMFDIQTDSGIRNFLGGNPTINNSGSLIKSAGSATTTIGLQGPITFNNPGGAIAAMSGALALNGAFNPNGGALTAGTLTVSGNGASGGSFAVDNGALLDFAGGTNTVNAGHTYAGAGTYRVSGGQVDVNGALTATSFELTGGAIGGAGATSVSSSFGWSDGRLGFGAGAFTALPGSTTTISGASDLHEISNYTFNNQGSATWASGAGELRIQSNGVFNNSGTLDIQTDAGVRNFAGGSAAINNSGTMRKTGGSGTTTVGIGGTVTVGNSGGTIDVRAGSLSIAGAFTQDAASHLMFGIGGTSPLTGYGVLAIGGSAPFAGATLTAYGVGGFLPASGDVFDVMTFASNSGSFGTKNLSLGSGASLTDSYPGGLLRLTAQTGGTLQFASATYGVGENAGTAMVTINRVNGSDGTAGVSYSIADVSTDGTDHGAGTPVSPLSFAAGVTSATITIPITDDSTVEPTESFTLTLSSPTGGAVIGTPSSTTLSITDNDTLPEVNFATAAQASIDESGTITVTVQLSAPSGSTVTVPFSIDAASTATAGDYTISASPIAIPSGSTTGSATITIAADAIDEASETVVVNLGTPTNATLGATAQHVATITDDDNPPAVAFTAALQSSAGESGTMTVTAQLSSASSFDVTVPFTTSGTASGTDYTITASPISIVAGATNATITITIASDALDEPNETVVVTMDTPVNATAGAVTQHTATITDDDNAPTVSFATAAQSSSTESGTMTIAVQLSSPSSFDVTVPFTTSGTAGGSDFAISASPLVIPAGSTTGSITITITADTIDESDETVVVALGAPSNATMGAITQHTATIVDDDVSTAALSIANATITENNFGAQQMQFTVTLSAASLQTVTVSYATADGSASAGFDYTAASGTLTFGPGQLTQSVAVTILGDTIDELDETFSVDLSNAQNATIAAGHATGTISDDDGAPELLLLGSSFNEGSALEFTVTLGSSSVFTVTVDYATVAGTATPGEDYTNVSGTLRFPPGELTKVIAVPVSQDSQAEPNETVFLTLFNAVNATMTSDSAAATIVNDDGAPLPEFDLAVSGSKSFANDDSRRGSPVTYVYEFNDPAGRKDVALTVIVRRQLSQLEKDTALVPSAIAFTLAGNPNSAAGTCGDSVIVHMQKDQYDPTPNEEEILCTVNQFQAGLTMRVAAAVFDRPSDPATRITVTAISNIADSNLANNVVEMEQPRGSNRIVDVDLEADTPRIVGGTIVFTGHVRGGGSQQAFPMKAPSLELVFHDDVRVLTIPDVCKITDDVEGAIVQCAPPPNRWMTGDHNYAIGVQPLQAGNVSVAIRIADLPNSPSPVAQRVLTVNVAAAGAAHDLAVAVTATPANPFRSEAVRYHFDVTGLSRTTVLTVTRQLSDKERDEAGFTMIASRVSATGGTCATPIVAVMWPPPNAADGPEPSEKIVCTFERGDANGAASVDVDSWVFDNTTERQTVIQAVVASEDADANVANNRAVIFQPRSSEQAEAKIEIAADRSTAGAGSLVTYTVRVTGGAIPSQTPEAVTLDVYFLNDAVVYPEEQCVLKNSEVISCRGPFDVGLREFTFVARMPASTRSVHASLGDLSAQIVTTFDTSNPTDLAIEVTTTSAPRKRGNRVEYTFAVTTLTGTASAPANVVILRQLSDEELFGGAMVGSRVSTESGTCSSRRRISQANCNGTAQAAAEEEIVCSIQLKNGRGVVEVASFVFDAPDPLSCQKKITALVAGADADPELSNNDVTHLQERTNEAVAASVAAQASTDRVGIGGTALFTVDVQRGDSDDEPLKEVHINLSPGARVVSMPSECLELNETHARIVCSFPQDSWTFSRFQLPILVQVHGSSGAKLTALLRNVNMGTIAQSSASVSSVTFAAATADVSVALSGPASISRGRDAAYRATIRNQGAAAANAVSFNLTGGGLSLASSDDCPALPCELGAIAPGATRTLTLSMRLAASTDGTQMLATAYASVEADSDISNNGASMTSAIACESPVAPSLSAVSKVTTGTPFILSWSADGGAQQYEVDESTNADFTGAVTRRTRSTSIEVTQSSSAVYYYRVRATASCNASKGDYSASAAVSVVPPPALAPPPGSNVLPAPYPAPVPTHGELTLSSKQLRILSSASAPTFVATTDQPWLTVEPSSGVVTPEGVRLQVTANSPSLPIGTSIGNISVQVGQAITTVPIRVSLAPAVTEVPRVFGSAAATIVPVRGSTDIRIANKSAKIEVYTVSFAGTGATSKKATVALSPGEMANLADINGWFGDAIDSGTLTIEPSSLVAASTVVLPMRDAAATGDTLILLRSTAAPMTLLEVAGAPAVVRLGGISLTLGAGEQRVIDQAAGAAEIEVVSGSGRVVAFSGSTTAQRSTRRESLWVAPAGFVDVFNASSAAVQIANRGQGFTLGAKQTTRIVSATPTVLSTAAPAPLVVTPSVSAARAIDLLNPAAVITIVEASSRTARVRLRAIARDGAVVSEMTIELTPGEVRKVSPALAAVGRVHVEVVAGGGKAAAF